MNTIAFTKRWHSQRWASIFSEITEKNTHVLSYNALQFYFGTIVKKRTYKLTPEWAEAYSKYTLVNRNDIVINGLNLNYDFVSQRIGMVREPGIITSAYISLHVKYGYNPAFYCYLLKAMDSRKRFHGMGTGIRLTLSFKDLRNIDLPVPPCDEQDQIVRFLDWKVSSINRAINIRKKQIEKLEDLKRSNICHIIMGKENTIPKKKSAIGWVKTIPTHWNECSLIQVAEEQQIKNIGMIEDNLLSLSYGKIIRKDINTTDGLLPTSFENYQIVNNGNIILRLTDLQNDHKSLRTGIVTQTGIITSAYTCLKARENILPGYLQLQLHVADLHKVFYGMGGGVRQSIGFKEIRKLIIAVPPMKEQQKLIDAANNIEISINQAIQKNKNIILVLEELRTRLISDVVTGKIDVRGITIPEYEFVDEEKDSDAEEGTEEQED